MVFKAGLILLFSFQGTTLCGDNSKEDTPVPISNTVVKLLSADDTWWEAAWESRTLPLFSYKKQTQTKGSVFFLAKRQRLSFPESMVSHRLYRLRRCRKVGNHETREANARSLYGRCRFFLSNRLFYAALSLKCFKIFYSYGIISMYAV